MSNQQGQKHPGSGGSLALIAIVIGLAGNLVSLVANFQALISTLGFFASTAMLGIGLIGFFVNRGSIPVKEAILYSLVWTMFIALTAGGYYMLIKQPVTVYGQVLDDAYQRNPVGGVQVSLYEHATGATRLVSTDSDGKFRFADVSDGEYDLIVDGRTIFSGNSPRGMRKLLESQVDAGRFYLVPPVTPVPSPVPTRTLVSPGVSTTPPTDTPVPPSATVPTDTPVPPTPMSTDTPVPPSPTPASDPLETALERARTPVASNADWEPFVWNFDDVEMVLVPAGCFMMGSAFGDDDEAPVNQQCFDQPFWIDKYEVTNAQFDLLGGVADRKSHWAGDNFPRQNITWVEAQAFCELRGARLPTEAEWEYAGRGPDELLYPWGNAFTTHGAIYFYNSNRSAAEVGSEPDGPSWIGAYDMSGNMWEWVSSQYAAYPYAADDGREDDDGSTYRVLRGGSWSEDRLSLYLTNRKGVAPTYSSLNFGFRCARSS